MLTRMQNEKPRRAKTIGLKMLSKPSLESNVWRRVGRVVVNSFRTRRTAVRKRPLVIWSR